MPLIELKGVTKEFRLGRQRSFGQSLGDLAAQLRGKTPVARAPFKALEDVGFSVEPGEVLGIIGHNGAGKSTLLKLIAGITKPTRGRVAVRGKVAPLIEVGAGLVPDLTGRENIYVNGAILGMKRAEIARKLDEIVGFAELEEFIDTPVKRYSSGMMVRLGFSIATSVEAEILIVDEVLAVGDLAFQRKCLSRMEEFLRDGRTILFVSHHIRIVERLCSRVMILDHGRLVADGAPRPVCNAFLDQANEKIRRQALAAPAAQTVTDELSIEGVDVLGEDGRRIDRLRFGSGLSIRTRFAVKHRLERICLLVGIHTTDFVRVTSNNTFHEPRDFSPGDYEIELRCPALPLLPGVYSVRVWIGTPENRVAFYGENLATFQVFSDDYLVSRQQDMGLVHIDATWHYSDRPDSRAAEQRSRAAVARR